LGADGRRRGRHSAPLVGNPKEARYASYIVAGIDHRAPTNQVLWKVEFEPREGATYLSRENALGPQLTSVFPGSGIGMNAPVDPVHDP
jgi:hypothetical protein